MLLLSLQLCSETFATSVYVLLDPVQTSCFCRAELNCNLVRLLHGRKSTLIQTSGQSRIKSRVYWSLVTILLLTPRGNEISPKHIDIIYEFSLARQKHDVWIAAVPESCSTPELVELNCLPNLIQKFDSDAVILPCFCREFSSARQKHDVWTGPQLFQI